MTPAEITAWGQVANAVGTVGVLALLVVAFTRGDIIPKVIFNRVLEMYERQLAELLKVFSAKLDKIIESRSSRHGDPAGSEFTHRRASGWVDQDERRD